MPIKIISRDFQAQVKKFDPTLRAKDYLDDSTGYTIVALPKDVIEAAKKIKQDSVVDSLAWRESLITPRVFHDLSFLRAWNAILSLHRIPQSIALFQNRVYEITEVFPAEELKLTILETADRERKKFERLTAKFDPHFQSLLNDIRQRIPESTRIYVWRRDQGKCARCGTRENLTYDHIIPVSKGGGNSPRNVELLCDKCNRKKGDSIG